MANWRNLRGSPMGPLSFDFTVQRGEADVTVRAHCYYDTPDPEAGYPGGWVLEFVRFSDGVEWDASELERDFGADVVEVIVEQAGEEAYSRDEAQYLQAHGQ